MLDINQTGDFYGPMAPETDLVFATGIESLTLTDQRGTAQSLDRQIRLGWSEPQLGLLRPAMTALGSGQKNDGLHFPRQRNQTGAFDILASLHHAGLSLGPEREALALKSDPTRRGAPGPYSVETAYDAPLIVSLLNAAGSDPLARDQTAMVVDWTRPYVKGSEPRPLDLQLYRRILATNRPGKPSPDSVRATTLPLDAAQPPAHSADPFAFDPSQHLRQRWTDGRDPEADDLTLMAICAADDRWNETLVPLVLDIIASLPPKAAQETSAMAALQHASAVLKHLGRPNLADRVIDSVDWSAAAKAGMASPEVSPSKLRNLVAKVSGRLKHC